MIKKNEILSNMYAKLVREPDHVTPTFVTFQAEFVLTETQENFSMSDPIPSRNSTTAISRHKKIVQFEIDDDNIQRDHECLSSNSEHEDELSDNDLARHKEPFLKNHNKTRINDTVGSRVIINVSENDKMASSPSTQKVHLEEEDLNLLLTGYQFHRFRLYIYYALCFLSCGIFYLIGRWMPKLWIWWVGTPCEMKKAQWVVVKSQWGDIKIENIRRKFYGGALSTIFSPVQPEEPHFIDLPKNSSFDETLLHMHFFDHRYIRFIYHPWLGKFIQHGYWKDPSWNNTKSLKYGIRREIHDERLIVFGQNLIDLKAKSTLQLLVDEVLHPFYIFQVFSIVLWGLEEYYYYAICIFIISATSVTSTLIETKQTVKRLAEMSKFLCNIRVFRGGLWRYVSSDDLVPGDVFEISDPDLQIFPCDALLLSGDCIVNESMLTGESIPVSKLPISDSALRTKIIRVRKGKTGNNGSSVSNVTADDEGGALAMVVRTGFNTSKGALIRSILFPKPNKFKFYRDSFRFIGVLSLVAVIGFIISSYNFLRMGVNLELIILRALDLITIVIPPALPATMSVGTNFAIERLKKCGIHCISPNRVNIGGQINVMCFDKTGTLTEDGLDVLGVRGVDHKLNKFSELCKTIETFSPIPSSFTDPSIDSQIGLGCQDSIQLAYAMATCHSLKLVNGELIGDPLDLKMFEFTRWVLEEGGHSTSSTSTGQSSMLSSRGTGGIVPTVVRPPGSRQFNLEDVLKIEALDRDDMMNPFLELGIIRTFEFVSSLRRMSVIVKRLKSHTMEVYVKGAPEIMIEICKKESLPQNYQEILNYYAHHGYRVIACAARSFNDLTWMKAQKVKRDQIEQELQFLGFIIFENKLKPGTKPVIDALKTANIRQIMCTGDNVLTAISVARECGIISNTARAYVPRFVEGSANTPRALIIWESFEDPKDILDPKTLKPLVLPAQRDIIAGYPPIQNFNYDIAVPGDVFRWIMDYGEEETLLMMLIKGQVFARMSPDEKHELVHKLQDLDYCVGFCGDGANDCGALKAADVGISLSEAEASVAAPFTSSSTDITCVLQVIREGRAALVTSFSCFKYMALYSIIQFTTVSVLYAFSSNLGDFQFLYIDLFLILPIAVLMGRTEPYPEIHPKRPAASLVSKKVLTSMIGQIMIQSGFQFMIYFLVRRQPWYIPPEFDPDAKNVECFENTVLFLLSCFQYIVIAVVFSVGPPYRKPMTTNVPFVVATVFLAFITAVLVISTPEFAKTILELRDISHSFRWILLLSAAMNFGISWVCEKYLFNLIAQSIGRISDRGSCSQGSKSQKKLYKRLQDMHIQ
ncbi:hypothetical protein G9A89_006748 [Geosiphon pyriformis]|nr:hypothetical protein G9A89_006748 [Geosiphon pyriformis]